MGVYKIDRINVDNWIEKLVNGDKTKSYASLLMRFAIKLGCIDKNRLLAYSGMRKVEAFALTWEDIDFKDYEITLIKSSVKVKDRSYILSPLKPA